MHQPTEFHCDYKTHYGNVIQNTTIIKHSCGASDALKHNRSACLYVKVEAQHLLKPPEISQTHIQFTELHILSTTLLNSSG